MFGSIGSLGKSDTWAAVHDVKVNGAILSNTNNGVRIKTWQVNFSSLPSPDESTEEFQHF